jgi:uncharacterized protein (TIGR00369 family)
LALWHIRIGGALPEEPDRRLGQLRTSGASVGTGFSLMAFQAQNPNFKAFIEQVFSAQPFMMALGARLGRVDPGAVELILSIRPDHLQHGGAVHGGVIGAIADNAAGAAAASLLAPGQATVTAEYRISFLSPAVGDTLIARGAVLKPGRSIIHTKCDVMVRAGDRETLVATALSSMVPFAMRSG